MNFFIDCIPPKTSHHAKRIVRRGKFSSLADKPELVAARESLLALLLPHAPKRLMDGPLYLSLAFVWPYNAGDQKALKLRRALIRHATRPDCDNLAKTFIDTMVRAGFFAQDSRVVSLDVAKYRGHTPGIMVVLEAQEPVLEVTIGQLAEMAPGHPVPSAHGDQGLAAGESSTPDEGSGGGPRHPHQLSPDGRCSCGSEIVHCGDCGLDLAGKLSFWDGALRRCTGCHRRGLN